MPPASPSSPALADPDDAAGERSSDNGVAANRRTGLPAVVTYQQPLAYLLGLEGVALLRSFGGEYDRDFCEARIEEIRRLLSTPQLAAEGVEAARVSTVDGYRVWSETYDQPGNGLYPAEEPFVHEILGDLPPGVALDVACGTGRHAEYLAGRGHRVVGVDSSPEMLDHARR